MKLLSLKTLLLAALLTTTFGCKSTSGRIKDEGEAVGVDQSRGGIAVYDEIMADTLEKVLAEHRGLVNVQNPAGYLVAFVGIDSLGAEDLRDHKPALYDIAEEVLLSSRSYRMVSMRFVERAKQEAGLVQTEDLFLPKYRDAFMSHLSTEGLVPDYLMWGKMTTQSTQVSKKVSERRYRLSLEMIDAHSGQLVSKKSSDIVKEYKK